MVHIAASAKQAGGANRSGGDEAAAKDGHHERSDKENQIKRNHGCQKIVGGVGEMLAKDCEKAWTHAGWEDTMLKWYEWLEHMKKKDEKEKWRRCISERWRS